MKNKILVLYILTFLAINCSVSQNRYIGSVNTPTIENFIGIWRSEYIHNPEDLADDLINSSFELRLDKDRTKENSIYGWHCALERGGRKIDYAEHEESSIHGYLKNDTVYLHFISSWGIEGKAKLYFDNMSKDRSVLIWEVVKLTNIQQGKEPEFYIPLKDTLQRVINVHTILPDESIPINKKKVNEIRQVIAEIDSIPLICDTTYFESGRLFNGEFAPIYIFEGFYSDKKGRLRKYLDIKKDFDSEREIIAYYDKAGELIYIRRKLRNYYESSDEYYYIDDKLIVDFGSRMEGYYGQKGIPPGELERTQGLIGSVLKESIIRRWSDMAHTQKFMFKNYLEAKTLMNLIEWDGIGLRQPGTFDKRKASDITYYESLEAVNGNVRDSINNPKAYLIEVSNRPYQPDTVCKIVIKEDNRFVAFTINPRKEYIKLQNFTIDRQDIDDTGSEELIIRWKKEISIESEGILFKNSGLLIWDLDTYTCLLDFHDTYIYNDDTEEELELPIYLKYDVNIGKKELSIQKTTDFMNKKSDKEKRGLKYIYKLVEPGFILDKIL